jgi:hypothetical protein
MVAPKTDIRVLVPRPILQWFYISCQATNLYLPNKEMSYDERYRKGILQDMAPTGIDKVNHISPYSGHRHDLYVQIET